MSPPALHREKTPQTLIESMPLLISAEDRSPSPPPIPQKVPEDDSPFISVKNMSASWTCDREKCVLQNISLELNKASQLLAVVGPVGAGKVFD